MPRDSNGIYTLPASNPVVVGAPISAGWANPSLQDIAQALTDSITDAPKDGQQYARKSSTWTVIDIPPSGIPEAPSDNSLYARRNAAWAQVVYPVNEAPQDGQQYARKNAGWSVVAASGGAYLPLTGGTITGNLAVNGNGPSNPLSVKGANPYITIESTAALTGAGVQALLAFKDTAGSQGYIGYVGASTLRIGNVGDNPISFVTNNAEVASFKSGGAVFTGPVTVSNYVTVKAGDYGGFEVWNTAAPVDHRRFFLRTTSGGNFELGGVNDANNQYVTTSLHWYVTANKWCIANDPIITTATGTFTAGLSVNCASPGIGFGATASGQAIQLVSYVGGKSRWNLQLGDGAPESGGNTGSNFVLHRYADDGSYLGAVMDASRANGSMTFRGNTVTNGIAYFAASGNCMITGADANYTDFWMNSGPYGNALFRFARTSGAFNWSTNTGSSSSWMSLDSGGNVTATSFILSNSSGNFSLNGAGASNNPRGIYFNGNLWSLMWQVSTGDLVYMSGQSHATLRTSDKSFILWAGPGYKPGGGPWTDTSDGSIKQNIRAYTTGLTAVRQLQPRLYNFIPETGRDATKDYVGLIAQDVQPVMPEMVYTVPVDDAMRGAGFTTPATELLALDTNALTYALVNAVQELAGRIETLEAKP